MKPTKTCLGREIQEVHEFNSCTDDFENYYAAQKWLKANGYSDGSPCALYPVAIIKGEYNLPQKWMNMSTTEKNSVHGVMMGDLRSGTVKVIIFKNQDDD